MKFSLKNDDSPSSRAMRLERAIKSFGKLEGFFFSFVCRLFLQWRLFGMASLSLIDRALPYRPKSYPL